MECGWRYFLTHQERSAIRTKEMIKANEGWKLDTKAKKKSKNRNCWNTVNGKEERRPAMKSQAPNSE